MYSIRLDQAFLLFKLRYAQNPCQRIVWLLCCLILGTTVLFLVLPSALVTESSDGSLEDDNAAEMHVGRLRAKVRLASSVEEVGAEMAETDQEEHRPKPANLNELIDAQIRRARRKKAKNRKPMPAIDPVEEFSMLEGTPGRVTYPKARKATVPRLEIHQGKHLEPWQLFQNGIAPKRLYDPDDPAIEKMLRDLQKQPIIAIEEPDSGTQIKLFMDMANGGSALFKPMRFSREFARRGVNQYYFSEFERHNAEIAAYHLDRVMGLYRVPPTVGRIFNISHDIQRLAAENFNNTIFVSPGGNLCFHGTCDYYCNTGHAICGQPDLVEGSFQALIPLKSTVPRFTTRSPWRRSYMKRSVAKWENDPFYCEGVVPLFGRSRALLDVIDVALFDFLNGNQDRHHLDTFRIFGNESFPVLFDNGRAFGDPDFDDMVALKPLMQCCIIRYSTLKNLLRFVFGPQKLSEAFIESSKRDPVYPLVTEDFVEAMDRRLYKLLKEVRTCVSLNPYDDVVLDDGY